MITKIYLFLSTLVFSSVVFSQQEKITGRWLLTKVITNGKTQNPYFFVDYKPNGKMSMRGMEVADWKKEGNKIIQISKIPDLNNEGKIIKLNSEEMVIKFPSNSLWFQKFDKEKLIQNPTFQSLLGVWKMQDTQDAYFLKFKEDLSFVMLQKNANSSISTKGKWLFFPKKQELLLSASLDTLQGISKIVSVNETLLELENNGIKSQAIRYVEPTNLEYLSFNEEDFPEDTNDQDKLPWRDFEVILESLNDVKTLTYKRLDYEKDLEMAVSDDVYSDFNPDLHKNKLEITDYYLKNGKKQIIRKHVKGYLQEAYNNFFPWTEIMPYRVVSQNQKITTQAGKFECTIIEGMDGDKKFRYYMINSLPGIFIKIVIEKNGDNDYHIEYILTKITGNNI